ncbi:hypothetical protein [Hydrogenimonas urashimensis]|uniref:hypothetical protein n=1 Tax=Hydrogenimonas urashimensis TaxID=2740515 RepID=UPI00191611BF|nr:hypothetical protein [Hydrogenimonas urashimensis]
MKKIDTVLHHLVSQPIYARLRERECFRRIKAALPEPMRRGILFMYIKNRTLFFVVKHPAFKMEFDYKLSLIKNLLSSLPPVKEACIDDEITEIRAFVSKFSPAPKPPVDTEPRYRERARGTFDADSADPSIKEVFAQIKKSIEHNLRR